MICGQIASAQTQLPEPIRYYPLENGSAKEIRNRKDGTINGTVHQVADRFGLFGHAMQFEPNAYISTPGFFEGSTYKNGFAISFWIKIDQDYTKKIGVRPWDGTDYNYRVFYADTDGQPILGFSHRRDRAVVDRMVLDAEGQPGSFGIWYWDPVNFTRRQGWYQIFLVCQNNQTLLYSFYPTGELEYALFYMGFQNLDLADAWGIGSRQPRTSKTIDDFKVYAQPLTKEQVIALHTRESMPDGMYEVSAAYDASLYWQTRNKEYVFGRAIDMTAKTPGMEPTRQWVFEPVPERPGYVKIRMAYFDVYLSHADPHGAITTDTPHVPADLEWIIEPTGDGYFFIRQGNHPPNTSRPRPTVRAARCRATTTTPPTPPITNGGSRC